MGLKKSGEEHKAWSHLGQQRLSIEFQGLLQQIINKSAQQYCWKAIWNTENDLALHWEGKLVGHSVTIGIGAMLYGQLS